MSETTTIDRSPEQDKHVADKRTRRKMAKITRMFRKPQHEADAVAPELEKERVKIQTDIEGYDKELAALEDGVGLQVDKYKGIEGWADVTLPEEWHLEPLNRDEYVFAADEKGRRRIDFHQVEDKYFVRDIHPAIELGKSSIRFKRAQEDYEDDKLQAVIEIYDHDGQVLHTVETEWFDNNPKSEAYLRNRAHMAALRWLEENYPDWMNPTAYWD